MSLSLSEGPQCKHYKVAEPIQGTKEDKAKPAAVPQVHNQNRNEANGKGRGAALEMNGEGQIKYFL